MTKKYYKKTRFRPKKPIRTFRDLIVYQKALENSIVISKKIAPILEKDDQINTKMAGEVTDCSLQIPRMIAEAHSIRFNDSQLAIDTLEKAMAMCNKVVVYIEQIKEIYGQQVDQKMCLDLIKKYTYLRTKIFNLEKSWKKFMEKDKND